MQKQRNPTNDHSSREAWLRSATNELRPIFAKLGLTIPEAIRFSIAFTSQGKKAKVAGEVWPASATDDGHCELIVRADFADPMDVLGILVHQLVHASLPPEAKHGKLFRDAALRLGLEGPMRNALPGAALRERLNELAASLGPLPHARLNFDKVTLSGIEIADRPRKQTTRMLKAECLAKGCGYTVRVAARWLADLGAPHCPKHGAMTTPPLPQDIAPEQDTSPLPTTHATE
ncbi:MAG: transcription elongation protein SprT [Mesorhizobium sp.]